MAGQGYCGAEQNECSCYATASCYAALVEDEARRLISRSYLTRRTQLPPRKTASQESAARTQMNNRCVQSCVIVEQCSPRTPLKRNECHKGPRCACGKPDCPLALLCKRITVLRSLGRACCWLTDMSWCENECSLSAKQQKYLWRGWAIRRRDLFNICLPSKLYLSAFYCAGIETWLQNKAHTLQKFTGGLGSWEKKIDG